MTLKFTYEGKEYTLEYTRKTVREMERRGFVIGDVADKPVSTLPALFSGAFLAHHRFLEQKIIDEIFDKMGNKEDLIGKLAEMYNAPIVAMVDDSDQKGKVKWTVD